MANPGIQKKKISRLDVLALGLCAVVFLYLFWEQHRGFGFIDEGFYYSVTQRLAQGDRFIIDEWHLGQFAALFQYLPYRLFTAVSGGTDGVILFMRYVYLTVDLVLFWLYYLRLRKYGLPGLLGAVFFCAYLFAGICAINYYTLTLHAMMTVGLLLFPAPKKPGAPTAVFAGVVLACAVLAQPAFLFLYLIFSLAVLARVWSKKKRPGFLQKYDFVLNGGLWLRITAGAAFCAVLLLVFLAFRNGIAQTLRILPKLLGDSEYAIHFYGNTANPYKLKYVAEFYCAPLLILEMLAIPAAALVMRKHNTPAARLGVFSATAFVILLSCGLAAAHYFRSPDRIEWLLFPAGLHILFLTPVCYLLCCRKEPRIFAFWWAGIFTCAVMDFVSEATVDFGASLMYFPAAYYIFVLLKELRGQTRSSGGRRVAGLLRRSAATLAALLALWSMFISGMAVGCKPVEIAKNGFGDKRIDTLITSGPYKGIRTTEDYRRLYEDMLTDLDAVRQSDDGPFYVADNMPYFYLYADKPFGTYSTWYVSDDKYMRMYDYWKEFPERQPKYIYIPLYDYYTGRPVDELSGRSPWQKSSAFFQKHTQSRIIRGRAGYLFIIDSWDIGT